MQYRWKVLRALLTVGLLVGLIGALAPAAPASTVMNPYKPWADSWGVKGKTGRNNSCNGVVCSNEKVYLERSSWSGYRYVSGTTRTAGTSSTLYTGRGCRSGTYDYHTEHKQTITLQSEDSFTVWHFGAGSTTYYDKTFVYASDAKRLSRDSASCENGSL